MMTVMHQKIIKLIPKNARVLDLGCGNGDLLFSLIKEKNITGYGIDIEFKNVKTCIEKGLPIYQGNINEGLAGFSDQSFDYVILSQTLQETINPLFVINEILRIGKKGIVTFPNFAYWKPRLMTLCGQTPVTSALPFSWYNTPNIRVLTIKDFCLLCQKENIAIKAQLSDSFLPSFFHNLFGRQGLFVIQKR